MPVLVRTRRAGRGAPARATIRRRAERMLAALALDATELSVLLCDDATMRALNRAHRGFDRSTDVLAFAMHEGEAGDRAGALLGDVVVSVPTARRQARAARRGLLDEITMLLGHGLLHLCGWDHRTAAEDRAMRAETERLCAAAGASRRR